MNLLIFLQNTKKGGVDTFVSNLINFWPDKNAKIYLVCNKSHPGIENLKKKIIKKKNIKIKLYKHNLIQDLNLNYYNKFVLKILKYYYWIKCILFINKELVNLFQNINANKMLVVNGGYPGGEGCLSALKAWKKINKKNKSFYNFHNYAKKNRKGIYFIDDYLNNLVDKQTSQNSDKFLSVSKSCINSLKNRVKIKKKSCDYIYNGIDYKIRKTNQNTNIKIKFDNKKIILMLANYELRKGFKFIFKTFDEIYKKRNDIILLIYGDSNSSEFKNIQKLRNKFISKNNIYLKKFNQNVANLYKISDVVVIPSITDESFGYAYPEASLFKKPVVASKIGGLKEIIKNNYDGYLVNVNDYKDFSSKILKLVNNRKLSKTFTSRSYKKVKNKFNAKSMSLSYYKIINENK